MSKKTLAEVTAGSKYNTEAPETPDELKARLEDEKADKELARHKEKTAFWAGLITTAAVLVVCVVVLFVPSLPDTQKTWATTALSAILAGGVGYWTGKRS